MATPLQEKALKLELKQRFVDAAEVWESAGRFEKAIHNYARGHAMKRAIDLALAKGMKKKAAQLYLDSNIFDKAAELYRQERDYASSARALVKAGKVQDAALMFEKAEAWLEAARLLESVGEHMRAGELYNKAGDVTSAGRVYAKGVEGGGESGAGGKQDLARAAEVLTRVRDFEKAAELYVKSDEVAQAVLMFVRMGETERAAKLYSECQADVGFEVLSHLNPKDPSSQDIAHMFYLARDYEKAGRVFENLGEYAKAGRLFEKNRDYHHAAELFAAADDLPRAALLYEKADCFKEAGDFYLRADDKARAADCFEQAEAFYESGRLYYETARMDKALETLQKVSEQDHHAFDAGILVADILARQGYRDAALERYRQLLQGAALDPSTLDGTYAYALLLSEAGIWEEAEAVLGRIVGFRFGYRDVAQRLEQVRAYKARGAPAPAAPAAPAQAAPRPTGEGSMVGRLDGFDVLRATSLFEELTLDEMRRFWEIAEIRQAPQGGQVLVDGAEGEGLYLIKQGSVYVTKLLSGKQEILVQLYPGEYFGEMALIDPGSKVSATIVAAGNAAFFFFGREAFMRLLEINEQTAQKMYRVFVQTLCRRLRQVSADLAATRSALPAGHSGTGAFPRPPVQPTE